MWQGQLLHIHTARAAREAMQSHLSATLMPGVGIAGDRYATELGTYSALPDIREVTLIEDETLIALLRDHAIELAPHEHRQLHGASPECGFGQKKAGHIARPSPTGRNRAITPTREGTVAIRLCRLGQRQICML